MAIQTVTIPVDVPEGYEAVAYRPATDGELVECYGKAEVWNSNTFANTPWLILKPIKPATKTVRMVEVYDTFLKTLLCIPESHLGADKDHKRTTREPFDVELLE